MRSSIRLAAALAAVVTLTACGAQDRVQDGIDRANEVASEVQTKVDEATEKFEDAKQKVEFCTSAAKVVAEVETRDYAGAVDAGEDMVAAAPEEIRPQARTVLDGVVAFRDGDSKPVQSEAFGTAADDLRRYTLDTCDPRS